MADSSEHPTNNLAVGAEVVFVLLGIMELINPDLKDHCQRVARGANALARALGWPDDMTRQTVSAALLHDIGYMLEQSGAGFRAEFDGTADSDQFESHPVMGAKILARAESLKEARRIVKHHHEHFDGSGFPDGLKGDNIPIGARLIAIVDFFERITVPRGEMTPMDPEEAALVITEDAGIIYDPALTEVFLEKVLPTGVLDPPQAHDA